MQNNLTKKKKSTIYTSGVKNILLKVCILKKN